ncbi:MAG: dihydroxyacetone kinase subunit L [Rhodospirillales bacterium]|nr:dihydroxyacetone kinase subunit L [Rhodospirillales bacterium]
MDLDVAALRRAIGGVLAELEVSHTMLTELDGKIGDGDLGVTLLKAFRELDRLKPGLPEDLGAALTQAASGVMKVSSSSFGTLFATGLMATAKVTKGKTSVPIIAIPSLLDGVVQAMMARGKASLGDKTVLDALDAVARASEGQSEPGAMREAAARGVDAALDTYRDKPNRVGRARIFGDKTAGKDDPGMVAVKVMIAGLARA